MGWQEVYARALEKVAAEHEDSPIGVVGCWAKSINYPVCELDLIIISPSRVGFERRIEQDLILDIRYVDQEDIARRADDLLTLSLTECIIVQDPDLRLASLIDSLKNRAEKVRKNLATKALTNAVSYLGLGKRALKEGCNMSTSFWLLASGYSLLEVLIWAAGDTPRPSHLMKQFRAYGGEATTTIVKRRLDFLSRCYEAETLGLLERCGLERLLPTLAAKKTFYLLEANMVVDAYLYLGYLVVEVLKSIYKSKAESLPKTKPYKFVEEIENRFILGKGVVKLASFPYIDQAVLQDVDQTLRSLAQKI